MPSTRQVQTLRAQLLETAFQAREDRIDDKKKALSQGRAQVEAILESLRTLYQKDETLIDSSVLDDIKTAKLCVGIITRSDLERAADEVQRKATVAAHKLFLKKQRIAYKGTRPGIGKIREAQCTACEKPLDNAADVECVVCCCIVCPCGACGCRKDKPA